MGYIYYLQADEILHEENIPYIKEIAEKDKYNSVSFPFYHFVNSWVPSTDKRFYKEAIRMVKNRSDIHLKGDGWTFEGNIDPCDNKCPNRIFHFGWVFPNANKTKHIEHFKIYQNVVEYRDNLVKACNDKRTEAYSVGDFKDFPEIAKRFIGKEKYEIEN